MRPGCFIRFGPVQKLSLQTPIEQCANVCIYTVVTLRARTYTTACDIVLSNTNSANLTRIVRTYNTSYEYNKCKCIILSFSGGMRLSLR